MIYLPLYQKYRTLVIIHSTDNVESRGWSSGQTRILNPFPRCLLTLSALCEPGRVSHPALKTLNGALERVGTTRPPALGVAEVVSAWAQRPIITSCGGRAQRASSPLMLQLAHLTAQQPPPVSN